MLSNTVFQVQARRSAEIAASGASKPYGSTTSSEMTTGRLLVTAAGVGMPALGPGEPPGPTGSDPAPAGTPGDMIVPECMPPSTTPPWHELQLSPAMPAIGDPTTWSAPPPHGAPWHGAA
jgi:hypothetical protein